MSVEARYLGARSAGNWRTNNYNELNIIENGFLDEFRLAMANLQANNAAGGTRAGSFAYFGPGTGTSPLPIILAYFNGVNRDRRRRRGGLHVGELPQQHVSSTPLARFNPNPYAFVDAPRRRRGVARHARSTAGLPSNFLLANPDLLGGAQHRREPRAARCTTRWRSSSGAARPTGWRSPAATCSGHATELAVPVAADRRARCSATAAMKATSRTPSS